jgi:hypothetical protein
VKLAKRQLHARKPAHSWHRRAVAPVSTPAAAKVVAVRTESKFTSFKELAAVGAKEPMTVIAGITGPTGSGRAALWKIERETGARFKFVNYEGGGEAVLATLGAGRAAQRAHRVSEAHRRGEVGRSCQPHTTPGALRRPLLMRGGDDVILPPLPRTGGAEGDEVVEDSS